MAVSDGLSSVENDDRREIDTRAVPVLMTWIRTIPLDSAEEKLRQAVEEQKRLYPAEYATPVHAAEGGGSQIVASHSLIPDALYHAFATYGPLLSPDLPLSRRQHEMIATLVSVTNRCRY